MQLELAVIRAFAYKFNFWLYICNIIICKRTYIRIKL